jgi:hypothetical protein
LLTDTVSDQDGRQFGVADTAHVPSGDPERTSDLGPAAGRGVTRDAARGSGTARSPPPETDLSVFPIVPPVEPA